MGLRGRHSPPHRPVGMFGYHVMEGAVRDVHSELENMKHCASQIAIVFDTGADTIILEVA